MVCFELLRVALVLVWFVLWCLVLYCCVVVCLLVRLLVCFLDCLLGLFGLLFVRLRDCLIV